jgi:putative endonuclease
MGAYLYILRCADGSYYVGTTVGSLELRLAQHQAGAYDGYTARRRDVALVFSQHFERLDDAAAAERQIKGWRREKKEALIRGDYGLLPRLARRGSQTRRTAGSSETRVEHRSSRTQVFDAKSKDRHPEEHPKGASRRTHYVKAARLLS